MIDGLPVTRLAGIPFPHVDLETAAGALLSPAGLKTAAPWRLVNTYCISLMRTDPRVAATLRGEGVNLADGKPVAWLLRFRAGAPAAPGHVRGAAFFRRVLDEGRAAGVSHYLLGGTPSALAGLQAVILESFPGVIVAGAESPPFRALTPAEVAEQEERIRASGADIVWVGLGTPRQDIDAVRLARAVNRPVIGVGAAFDFLAGTRPEAPVWVQRVALEWFYRLVSEPRRLWRRYTIGLLRFGAVVAVDLLRPAGAPGRGR
ncbi:MAG TPA: WecB/TagA/CpsF family glycosyltransferase [Geodermatophilus sp.]|nr:WecB/TagA/CpsF family glycosyltransferase [Geodermatophilus sp.]